MTRIEKRAGLLISEIITSLLQDYLSQNVTLANSEIESALSIGVFKNGREEGYEYTVFREGEESNSSFTWCTYEHRNSDSIIINGKEGFLGYGDLPYIGESKNDFIASFEFNEYGEAAQFLAHQIANFIVNGKTPTRKNS